MSGWLPDGAVDPRWFVGNFTPRDRTESLRWFRGVREVLKLSSSVTRDLHLQNLAQGERAAQEVKRRVKDLGSSGTTLSDAAQVKEPDENLLESRSKRSKVTVKLLSLPPIFSWLTCKVRARFVRRILRAVIGRALERPLKPYVKGLMIDLSLQQAMRLISEEGMRGGDN